MMTEQLKNTISRKRRRTPVVDQTVISCLRNTYHQLKDVYADVSPILLFVERGDVKLLGHDADVVAGEHKLTWMSIDQTGSITVAKFSVCLLERCINILVSLGHIVGIVRRDKVPAPNGVGQLERTLDGFYSRSMYVGPAVVALKGSRQSLEVATCRSWFNFLVVLHETPAAATSNGESGRCRTIISMLAVCASSGTARYGCVVADDTVHAQQAKLRELLDRVSPVEVILPLVGLSDCTELTINRYATCSCSREERIRVQRFDEALFRAGNDNDDAVELKLRKVCAEGGIPITVRPCLWAVRHYAFLFDMEDVVSLIEPDRISPIEASSELAVDQLTARHLELFRSATTDQYEGSLFWSVADRIRTPFGLRLLKSWFQRVPISSRSVSNRFRVVRYFRYAGRTSTYPEELSGVLQRLPDLEAGLACIFYKKCTVCIYVKIIDALYRTREYFKTVVPLLGSFDGISMPTDVVTMFETVIDDLNKVEDLVDNVDCKSKTGLNERTASNVFVDASVYQNVAKVMEAMTRTRTLLDILGDEEILPVFGEPLRYGTFDGHDYVVVVPAALFHLVPSDWCTVWRGPSEMYVRSPTMNRRVVSLLRQGDQREEACRTAWNEFLELFRARYHRLKRAVQRLAEIDCLMALATSSREDGFNCRPMLRSPENDVSLLRICNGHHGVTEKVARIGRLPKDYALILANGVIKSDVVGCMVLRGSDEAVKQFVVRLIGTCVVLAQMGAYVQARTMDISPFASLVIRLGSDVEATGRNDSCWNGGEDLSTLGLLSNSRSGRSGEGNSLLLVDDDYFQLLVRNGECSLTDSQLSYLRSKLTVVEIVKSGRKLKLIKISSKAYLSQCRKND